MKHKNSNGDKSPLLSVIQAKYQIKRAMHNLRSLDNKIIVVGTPYIAGGVFDSILEEYKNYKPDYTIRRYAHFITSDESKADSDNN